MRASCLKRALAIGARPGVVATVLLVALTSLLGGAARANNGIPGSLGVLLPLDKPQSIGLATTFGLILSDDGGTSWNWTCEQAATSMADVYVVGPPPLDRFFARSLVTGLGFSDDGSCGWQSAGGALAGLRISDFFPDASDPTHVLAAAAPLTDDGGTGASSVYVSTDGGATFGATPLYTALAGAVIVGIEIARSNPQIIYLTTYTVGSAGYDPVLVRSLDGGGTWTPIDLLAPVGAARVYILAVDPADANLVYLRASGATSETLSVTRDGGTTFATPLTVANGAVSAFARLASGTVLVGALINLAGGGGATMGAGYRSTDGAVSFQPWTLQPQPHLVGLGERVAGGQSTLYLSGKNYSDGWALAVSTDEGATVTPVMRYDQVAGIKPCVQQVCLATCKFEETQAIWDLSVCGGPDGGPGDAGLSGPPQSSGCHCAAGGPSGGPGGGLGASLLAAAAFWRAGRGRRRRKRDRG
jgi:MYXO-CTERM domain-containing protein